MMRWTLGGLAAGMAVAMLVIMSVEGIGNQLYPPPRGYDLNQGSATSLPLVNLMFPVAGWFLGALAGAWVAVRTSGHAWAAWVIAGLVLAATILNLVLITHPTWVIVAGIAAPLLGGLAGRWLSGRSAEARPA